MSPDQVPQNSLSNPPPSKNTGTKGRHVALLSNTPVIGRSALASQIQQVATQSVAPGAKLPNLVAFLQVWKWVGPYLHNCFRPKARYRTYPAGHSGVFSINPGVDQAPLRIAMSADWGTGTLEAETVAENMKAGSPQCTIHLGDVYYMGKGHEIKENYLGESTARYGGVRWPPGSLGSFALMGNHEMYSGGHGYFGTLLKTQGLLNPDKSVRDPQAASYFCLDTGHWLLLGLDTGYHSGGLPILAGTPLLNRIPFLNVDARFDDKMMDWLEQTMNSASVGGKKKPILLLTHHQPMSAFEQAFLEPVKQLAKTGFFNNQDLVWIYGHEHRLTVYEKQVIAGLTIYPRCIGHGGMPVSVTTVDTPRPEIAYYDPRTHPIDENDPEKMVGYNGHVELVFRGATLEIEYHDILKNNILLTETFTPNGSGGLTHSSSKPADSPLQ